MSGKRDRDRRQPIAILLILLLVSGTLFFFRLGSPGLFDADEPAYAQAAREMLEGGDWVTPHFNGRPRFDKPILFYWLISLSYRLFGVTEFAVRFGPPWPGWPWFFSSRGPPGGGSGLRRICGPASP